MTVTLVHAAPTAWQKFWGGVQKDEQWVVSEISKAWAFLEKEVKTVETDILGIFNWIQTHQQQILQTFQFALTDLAAVGTLIPHTAPVVAGATMAIDAATAAIDVLSKGITQGTTPLSTVVNAYHAVKDAQTAVNSVLKAKTAAPAPAPAK